MSPFWKGKYEGKYGGHGHCRWITRDGRRIFACFRMGRPFQECKTREQIPKEWEEQHRKLLKENPDVIDSVKRYRGGSGASFIRMVAIAATKGDERVPLDKRVGELVRKREPVLFSGGDKGSEEAAQTVRDLDKILSKAKTVTDAVVWRGVSDRLGKTILRRRYKPGSFMLASIFKSHTYVSTSLLKKVAKRFLGISKSAPGFLLKIFVPEGLPGLYIGYELSPGEKYTDEMELILPRESRFRVRGVRNRMIELEYLGAD